ncbi:MAG: SCO family protein, partial [Rhodospirillaceae bacterium]
MAGFFVSWNLSNKPVVLEAATWFGDQAKLLPEFELVDQNKEPITREQLKGYWNLVFFGYTHCPDICPTALIDMNRMVQSIEDPQVREAVKVYFVSVDPERDTPEELGPYV